MSKTPLFYKREKDLHVSSRLSDKRDISSNQHSLMYNGVKSLSNNNLYKMYKKTQKKRTAVKWYYNIILNTMIVRFSCISHPPFALPRNNTALSAAKKDAGKIPDILFNP